MLNELLVAAFNKFDSVNGALLVYIIIELRNIKKRLSVVEVKKMDKVEGEVITPVMLSRRVN